MAEKSNQHTPGKWHVYDRFCIRGDDGRFLLDASYGNNLPQGEAEANAHLISASPELLQALHDLLFVVEVNENWGKIQREQFDRATKRAEAAIAKATGPTPEKARA